MHAVTFAQSMCRGALVRKNVVHSARLEFEAVLKVCHALSRIYARMILSAGVTNIVCCRKSRERCQVASGAYHPDARSAFCLRTEHMFEPHQLARPSPKLTRPRIRESTASTRHGEPHSTNRGPATSAFTTALRIAASGKEFGGKVASKDGSLVRT